VVFGEEELLQPFPLPLPHLFRSPLNGHGHGFAEVSHFVGAVVNHHGNPRVRRDVIVLSGRPRRSEEKRSRFSNGEFATGPPAGQQVMMTGMFFSFLREAQKLWWNSQCRAFLSL